MKPSGMAMVEALVASALLGLGLLGAARLTTHALDAAMRTRQEVQARALAAETLDCAIAHQVPCPALPQRQYQGVTYTIALQSTPLDSTLSELQVQVRWYAQGSHPAQTLAWYTRVSTLPDWVGVSSP
ncbi:MAG: hypothetical protein ACKOWC_10740 [Limnohabitans sp.]